METAGSGFDWVKMVGDYMENGLLENIIDMFKHDPDLYRYLGELLRDERMRVRIGIISLLETLGKEDPGNVKKALPAILPLLKNDNAVTRGDAAYALGIIGSDTALDYLQERELDEDPNVRVIAREAIEEILSSQNA